MAAEQMNAYSYQQTKADKYTISSLFIALFSDGTALIEQDVVVNPFLPNAAVVLYGKTVDGLNVMDYKGKSIEYQFGQQPGEVVINSSGITNARLSYETPDLVNKQGRTWTFSFNSTTGFSLKLPTNSTIIDLGKQFPASVTQIGEQGLLTFHPGHIQISYVIGYLGTESQSNASIESAVIAVKEAKNRYPGIILADTRGYVASQIAIGAGQLQVRKAAEIGHDTSAARALLSQADNEFSKGHYNLVKGLVDEAIISIGNNASNSSPVYAILGGIAVASTVVVIVLRKKIKLKRLRLGVEHDVGGTLSDISSESRPPPQPSSSLPKPSAPTREEPGLPARTAEQTALSRIVTRILAEKPHLRPEDQGVLMYLEIRKAGGQNLIKLRS